MFNDVRARYSMQYTLIFSGILIEHGSTVAVAMWKQSSLPAMNTTRIKELVLHLHLQPHPEGGFYGETYRSVLRVPTDKGDRPASTAIYFLLTTNQFSAFHRIKSDEVWHHYEGDTVFIHVLHPDEEYECICLGKITESGEVQQAVVPAGAWFASESVGPSGYALVGCTVAPGFDFEDFELADRQVLSAAYPQYQDLVARLTRTSSD